MPEVDRDLWRSSSQTHTQLKDGHLEQVDQVQVQVVWVLQKLGIS